MKPRLTHFAIPVLLSWLVLWWFIPRSFMWCDLSPLRWIFWNTGVYTTLLYMALCVLYRPKELTRFEKWSFVYVAIVGAVNGMREAFAGGANDIWEIILGLPFLLTLILLILDHFFEIRRKRKGIGFKFKK